MTKQERFEALQARWRKADEAASKVRFDLRYHYGDWWQAPRGKRERFERLQARADKAQDAIFTWLDQNSARQWRIGVPAHWVCDSLTFADATTVGALSVVPPVAYGRFPSDSILFAAAV